MSRSSRRLRPAPSTQRFAGALLGAILVLTALTAAVPAAGAEPAGTPPGGIRSTIHYEEAVAHQDDQITFEPGGRVTVGFTPRAGDRFLIGGERPRPLPAGRVTGRAMRGVAGAIPGDQGPGSPESGSTGQLSPPPSTDEPGVLGPGGPSPTETPALTATPAPTAEPTPTAQPTEGPPLDRPVIDPATVIQATESAVRRPGALEDGAIDLQATVNPAGLRKEVFGFLPYWELNSSTVLDWTKLSTIAFFGVGASAAGNLEKTTSTGSTTVGWSGWTSSRMTDVINEAHRNDTRVVLTIQSFGWSSAGLTKQKTLLGSSTARANLARQIAATVRDRGADGVNLDFEPLASGYDDEFTSLVRRIRTELDAVHKGYQLTFDTTGWIGNYPVADATAAGGADAIFIMGYDYRNGSASTVGSIAPIGGPAYDIRDTIAAYTARVSPSKLILGVPYYGRAWSTDTDKLGAKNISGTKYGASATVIYDSAVDYLADKGRRYDPVEGVAWTVYRRENCTTTYGCVTPWRQLYVDDAEALKAKYDLVNQYGLRGAGIWALGYDGSRKELWTAIRDKFITDTTPPRAGIRTLSATQSGEAFTVDWSSDDDFGVVSHDVDVSIDGGAWARWLTETPTLSGTYVGARGHAFAFRVRARDGKGNLSDWDGVPMAGGAPKVEVGAFGMVVTDTLNARAGAGTDKSIVQTLAAGDRVAFLQGPVSDGGYTWYRVAAPLSTWPIVGATRTDLWVAVGTSSDTYVKAVVPPNTTKVSASATLAHGAGATYFPMTPVRLLDTRVGNGLSGVFKTGVVRSFAVAGPGSPVPSTATAVTGNLTITRQTSAGYVSLGPTMSSKPSTSTLNAPKGDNRANGVTVKLSGSGSLAAVWKGSAGSTTHLVFDVTGYFTTSSTGATYHPLAPARLLDTRIDKGLENAFRTGIVRSFTVAGQGGVPSSGVTAITGNLTITRQTSAGYVSLGPTMSSSPTTSTLNAPKGDNRANAVTVKLSGTGRLSAVWKGSAGSTTHLVFDVTGYFTTSGTGATYVPLDPVRLLDTRSGNGLSGAYKSGTVRPFATAGRGTIPADATAVTGNLTITRQTSAGYVSLGPTMTSKPTTSTLNAPRGDNRANAVTVKLSGSGKLSAVWKGSSGSSTHLVFDATGYFR